MNGPKQAVATLRKRIRNGEREIEYERDRETLLEFSDTLSLLRETYGHHRHEKLLRHCTRMAEHSGGSIADALEDRNAAETIVRWIHDAYDLDETPETNQNYRVALKVFGRRVTDEGVDGPDSPPESLAWITSTLPNDYDPSPTPGEMLRWDDDVEQMLDGCRNARDEAAIAVQFDAGLRGGELFDLEVGDFRDSDHGLAVTVDGKTGERSVDLIPSVPYVNRWLAEHPGDASADFVWSHLTEAERLSYNAYLDMFKRPAARADVDKDVTPTAFRKSNLAWLCRQGMNARHIERRQGRVHGSDAVARYTAIFDDDVGEEYAKIMGLDVEETDDADEFAPVTCVRCGRQTPQREGRCVWCRFSLSHDAADEDAEQDRDIARWIAEHPEQAEAALALQSSVQHIQGIRLALERD